MKLIIFVTLFYSHFSLACPNMESPDFSNVPLTVGAGLTYEQTDAVIASVAAEYTETFKKNGLGLAINNFWHTDEENALSWIHEGVGIIALYGGYPRHRAMTKDALLGILCHEIGHFLGGEPRFSGETAWASAEGQADFFSSYECVRKVMKKQKNNLARSFTLDPHTIAACDESFKLPLDRHICKRTALSVKSYGEVQGIYNFDFEGEQKMAQKTIIDYPIMDCRLQTKYSGAFCKDSSCERLRCWYKYN